MHSLASRYAAFLNVAFDRDTGRFRNFMSFDRRWLEEDGSDDSQGRALWALGTCIGRSRRAGLAAWARELFHRALPACEKTTSPRTWALGIMGIHEYLRRYSGDRAATTMSQRLADRLIDMYDSTATDDWPWFENIATYNNAKLSQSLITHGRWSDDQRAADIGLKSLRWLCEKQLSPQGRFRPIGSNGFSREGRRDGGLRPASDRSSRDDFGVDRSLRRQQRSLLERASSPGIRLVSRPQRSRPTDLRCVHRRLLMTA